MTITSISKGFVSSGLNVKIPIRGFKVVCSAQQNPTESCKKLLTNIATFTATATILSGAVNAITFDELKSKTYMQVKGTGIASSCPEILGGSTNLKDLKPGTYTISNMCIEPSNIEVKEESTLKGTEEFVATKLMTRLTYTLDGLSGKLTIGQNGEAAFQKDDEGIDFAPVTVQLPGGERVPFLFTFKDFAAKGSLDGFSGNFVVPSYRGATFLDPKGRGAAIGYDTAVALPAKGDSEELVKENLKSTGTLEGTAAFSIAKIDNETGEIVGVFESVQPSDTDLGAKPPKDVKVTGTWYGRLS